MHKQEGVYAMIPVVYGSVTVTHLCVIHDIELLGFQCEK